MKGADVSGFPVAILATGDRGLGMGGSDRGASLAPSLTNPSAMALLYSEGCITGGISPIKGAGESETIVPILGTGDRGFGAVSSDCTFTEMVSVLL